MDRELTITLTDEEARLIDEQVESGAFASASEVVHAGLARMVEVEAWDGLETEWLRQKVQEALDDPRPSVPAEEAFARIRDHISTHASRRAKA